MEACCTSWLSCELSVGWPLRWIALPLVSHIWNICVSISIIIMSHNVTRKTERACGFRKGHPTYVSKKEDSIDKQIGECLARWMSRLTQAEFARVTKVTPAGLEGHSSEAKMLRPRRDDHDDDLTSTYLWGEDTREEMCRNPFGGMWLSNVHGGYKGRHVYFVSTDTFQSPHVS